MVEPDLEHSDVYSLFSTLVWKIDLERALYEPINAQVVPLLHTLLNDRRIAEGESWQSAVALHQRLELQQLVSVIEGTTRRILRFLHIASGGFEITGCWATVNAPGASHRIHSHPNNYLSGVYYAQVQPGADTINFHDPRPQAAILRPAVTELTGQNTDHSVDPNRSAEERISISFNIMFRSFAETLAKPMWGES